MASKRDNNMDSRQYRGGSNMHSNAKSPSNRPNASRNVTNSMLEARRAAAARRGLAGNRQYASAPPRRPRANRRGLEEKAEDASLHPPHAHEHLKHVDIQPRSVSSLPSSPRTKSTLPQFNETASGTMIPIAWGLRVSDSSSEEKEVCDYTDNDEEVTIVSGNSARKRISISSNEVAYGLRASSESSEEQVDVASDYYYENAQATPRRQRRLDHVTRNTQGRSVQRSMAAQEEKLRYYNHVPTRQQQQEEEKEEWSTMPLPDMDSRANRTIATNSNGSSDNRLSVDAGTDDAVIFPQQQQQQETQVASDIAIAEPVPDKEPFWTKQRVILLQAVIIVALIGVVIVIMVSVVKRE